ncbi:MAG: hypothetical protein KY467_13910 [Gemmatimonadetes bacterium]|nr:hypothetical protein [Gemmatimonadota bacterium]
MKILVVDDERAIRFSLAELLESEGHDVREAEHPPASLAALELRAFLLLYPDHDVAIATLANGPADFGDEAVARIAEPFLSRR